MSASDEAMRLLPSRGFGAPVHLIEDGLLEYINAELLLPLGYALALEPTVSAADATPSKPQCVLAYLGPEVAASILPEEEVDLANDRAARAFKRARSNLYDLSRPIE